ncbi:MAG: L-histidine N(alpha)-methyltransferase [Cyanobacteriota bacterium]|nr:L-histidine N(alpha)-methyltransferase [Cyanobacteriota bacterium]
MTLVTELKLDRTEEESGLETPLDWVLYLDAQAKPHDASEVLAGLTQTPKSLPPKYFYDERGSQLFEQICELPEYYPTRTEASILGQYAEEIASLTGTTELVELGSGSSTKTRLLLDAYQKQGSLGKYVAVDVSGEILEDTVRQLGEDYPALEARGMVGTYERALAQLKPLSKGSRTVMFLGSTLGNFSTDECDRFLEQVVTVLKPGDYFLLGIDLQKPQDILEAAYNDAEGITAAFNLNMLAHLNWRFEGDFNLALFEHKAIYNRAKSQIEMYLHCLKSHVVRLEKLDLTLEFEVGERILTEISRKFNLEEMEQYLADRSLNLVRACTDANKWFAVVLCQV